MLQYMVLLSSLTIMAKAAEMSDRSESVWVGITVAISLVCIAIIPYPLINAVVGFILSFLTMFFVNLYENRHNL